MHSLCQQISGFHQHSLHVLGFIPEPVTDRVLQPLTFQSICDIARVLFGLFCISPHLLRQVVLRYHVCHFCGAAILWSLSTLTPVKFWYYEKRGKESILASPFLWFCSLAVLTHCCTLLDVAAVLFCCSRAGSIIDFADVAACLC